MISDFLPCDGCGQPASPTHIVRRLERLEWATRYRPVHIGTLLLGAISPHKDADFLYSGKFGGEAARLLEAVGIQTAGKSAETVLTEFQRGGYFVTYVLECPLDECATAGPVESALLRRVGAVLARVRRSLRPKRALLFGEPLASVVDRFSSAELGCPVILDAGKPFGFDVGTEADSVVRLRRALAPTASAV